MFKFRSSSRESDLKLAESAGDHFNDGRVDISEPRSLAEIESGESTPDSDHHLSKCDRKRKERHESSNGQEKKVIRSDECQENTNPEDDTKDEKKEQQTQPALLLSPIEAQVVMTRTMPTSFEPELQRQLERSAPWSNARKVKKSHRYHHKLRSKVEEDVSSSDSSSESLDEIEGENELKKSNTPTIQILEPLPLLDLSTLHHQIESNEPISFMASINSDDPVMLSPRNSVLKESDPSIAPSPPLHHIDPPAVTQIHPNTKLNNLTKVVNGLKKQLKNLEEEHEKIYGYKPSQADRLNNRAMRKVLQQIGKLKGEIKTIQDDPNNYVTLLTVSPVKTLKQTVQDIEADTYRSLDSMNQSQLQEEKSKMQKHLLMLEKRHGRPTTKEDKDIVRNLYERYRYLKRVTKGNVKEAMDLVPILEHETLEINESEAVAALSIVEFKRKNVVEEDFTDFNSMELPALENRRRQEKDEQRKIKHKLKQFESDFQSSTGRPPQKDEKYSSPEMESAYLRYKRTRSTLRLLDVLIAKKLSFALEASED